MNAVDGNAPINKTPMEQVDELKYWLATAPGNWDSETNIRRYLLPTGEHISCVLWNSLFHITGTDIVRSLVFRFQAFGRPVKNIKKFEEGVFSDLRQDGKGCRHWNHARSKGDRAARQVEGLFLHPALQSSNDNSRVLNLRRSD